LQALDRVRISSDRERYLSPGQCVSHGGSALDDQRLLRENFLHQFGCFAFAPLRAEHSEGNKTSLHDYFSSLPFRIGKIFPAFRQLLRAHRFGVVGDRQSEIVRAKETLSRVNCCEAHTLFPFRVKSEHIAIDQRPQSAQRTGLNDIDSGRLASLTFSDDPLYQRLGNTVEVLNLNARILLVQGGLHALIDNRIRRPPYDYPALFLGGGIKLGYRLAVLPFVLRVAVGAGEYAEQKQNNDQRSQSELFKHHPSPVGYRLGYCLLNCAIYRNVIPANPGS